MKLVIVIASIKLTINSDNSATRNQLRFHLSNITICNTIHAKNGQKYKRSRILPPSEKDFHNQRVAQANLQIVTFQYFR
jgi:CDP-diacylglycerol pyrophosphatase